MTKMNRYIKNDRLDELILFQVYLSKKVIYET